MKVEEAAPIIFVDKLPKGIEMLLYSFSFTRGSKGKGIKKSRLRQSVRGILQQDIPDEFLHSRSYCGNEVLQVISYDYAVGCDYENMDRFKGTSSFFTNDAELNYIRNQRPEHDEHMLLSVIWGMKESLTKLLRIPLQVFLQSKTLRVETGRMSMTGLGCPVFVYTEIHGSNQIVITYCERELFHVWHF